MGDPELDRGVVAGPQTGQQSRVEGALTAGPGRLDGGVRLRQHLADLPGPRLQAAGAELADLLGPPEHMLATLLDPGQRALVAGQQRLVAGTRPRSGTRCSRAGRRSPRRGGASAVRSAIPAARPGYGSPARAGPPASPSPPPCPGPSRQPRPGPSRRPCPCPGRRARPATRPSSRPRTRPRPTPAPAGRSPGPRTRPANSAPTTSRPKWPPARPAHSRTGQRHRRRVQHRPETDPVHQPARRHRRGDLSAAGALTLWQREFRPPTRRP